jgi:hypothetical protein
VYEHRRERVLPVQRFLKRVVLHGVVAGMVVVGSLFGGMTGYAYFEHLSLLDAFLNAAMLLGGMGPVQTPTTPGGKMFAGLYALYSGMVFLVVVGIVLAPVVHRALHRFHWAGDDGSADVGARGSRTRR